MIPTAVRPTPPAGPAAVSCRAIHKAYGTGETEVRALRGVDLDVSPGELVMLVGPSGCGKTTLISVIAGVLDADGGECHLFGTDVRGLRGADRVRFRGRNVGFVFQAFNLVPALTAAENVAVPLLLGGARRAEALERARACLGRVGLGDRHAALPVQLSGGQQQRVAIARAIVHEPRLVVCDEPTSALDHETGQRVMTVLREVAVTADRALVIVTHDSRIFGFADRIAHLDDGKVVRVEGPPSTAPGVPCS